MSLDKSKCSVKPTAPKLIAAAFAVCINVLLLLVIGALFATDLSVSSGKVLL
jgi:hypothetical protein